MSCVSSVSSSSVVPNQDVTARIVAGKAFLDRVINILGSQCVSAGKTFNDLKWRFDIIKDGQFVDKNKCIDDLLKQCKILTFNCAIKNEDHLLLSMLLREPDIDRMIDAGKILTAWKEANPGSFKEILANNLIRFIKPLPLFLYHGPIRSPSGDHPSFFAYHAARKGVLPQ